MQTVTSTFRQIFRQPGHMTEIRAEINGEYYGMTDIYYVQQVLSIFSEDVPAIGCCCSGASKLKIIPHTHIPRMAEINLESRLVSPDGNSSSEWIPMGTYYTDTRSRERNGQRVTLTAYDAMLKADQPYLENSTLSNWPCADDDVADEIAALMGITVDSRTALAGYEVPLPEQDWTAREVLGWIGAANGGNWIITPNNELLLVKLEGITSLLGTDTSHALRLGDSLIVLSTGIKYEDTRSLLGDDSDSAIKFGNDFVVMDARGRDGSYPDSGDGQNIYKNARNLQNLGLLQPFTGVKLWWSRENSYEDQEVTVGGETTIEKVEVENAYFAGDDTGRVLEADCPWATQAIADAILAQIEGYVWQGAVVEGAEITPAAELGDPVICDGVAFPLCSLSVTYDGAYAPTISAPADEEVDYEFHYESETERKLARKVTLRQNYYGFKVTPESGIEIVNIVDGQETTRMILNSSVQAFYNPGMVPALYFDIPSQKYKFKGNVIITEGSLGLSDTFAIFPANATESEIEGLTVPTGFNLIGREGNLLYKFLRIYLSSETAVFASPAGGNAAFAFDQIDLNGPAFLNYLSKYPGFSGGSEGDQEIATVGYVKSLTVHPIIITQPHDVTAQVNDSVSFSVVAARATGYQWYWRSGPSGTWAASTTTSGRSATYTTTATTARNGQQYYCEVKNQYGSTYSDIVTLTVI